MSTTDSVAPGRVPDGLARPMPWGLDLAQPRDFRSPRDVLVGDGTAGQVGELLRRWDSTGRRAFVVSDAALPGLGITAPIEEALGAASYEVDRFDDVTAEPDLETTRAAVAAARTAGADVVVGIGGGSAMDIAKVVAALLTNDDEVADIVGTDLVEVEPVPLVLIPTTAGTGAEATRIAMLSEGGEKRIVNSGRLIPVGAILDPELVATLPPQVTAATGLDAVTHAAESLLSTAASALTARMSLEALHLLAASLPRAFDVADDLTARRGTLYGAYLAGLGLNAGVVLGHSIAYTIANRVKLPHGITTAMALPYCLAYSARTAPARIDQLARAAVGPDAGADDLFQWVDELNARLEVPPSLRALDLGAASASEMARECLEKYPRPTNPEPLTLDRLEELYAHLWRGDTSGYVRAVAL